jgi:hypothetical protein
MIPPVKNFFRDLGKAENEDTTHLRSSSFKRPLLRVLAESRHYVALAQKAGELLRRNPSHPSMRF